MTTIAPSPSDTVAPLTPPKWRSRSLLAGELSHMNRDMNGWFKELATFAPIMSVRIGHLPFYVVNDPDIAQHLLQKNVKNYVKQPRLLKIINPSGEDSLFVTDGDDWLWRRRLMQPAFHRKQIAQFGTAIADETAQMLDRWQVDTEIDVDEQMKLLTMYVIGRTMFSVDFKTEEGRGLHDAYRSLSGIFAKRLARLMQIPQWMPTAENRELATINETARTILLNIVEERRTATESKYDLLDMLLAARLEEEDKQFTADELYVEMSSIVFAGHETTATSLTWLFALLAEHPDVEARLLAEFDAVLGDRNPTMEDVPDLVYTNQVINEVLRLYSPAVGASRHIVEDDQVGEYQLKGGRDIFINIIGMHTHPDYWDDPLTFNPDRFAPDKMKEIHKFLFIPFLNGGRRCIGEPLARAEMAMMIPMIMRRYQLQLRPGHIVEDEVKFVLRPKNGLPMTIKERVK